jgi:hypothetical protein
MVAHQWNWVVQKLLTTFRRQRAGGLAEAERAYPAVPLEAETPAPWLELTAFSALVVAHLLPIWLFRHVPTQDGPSHLANAVILRGELSLARRQLLLHRFGEHEPGQL